MMLHSVSTRPALVLAAALTMPALATAQFQPRIAIVAAASATATACAWTDPLQVLQQSGQFAVVDVYNVMTTGTGTPTLTTLLQYDAILTFTNGTPANNVALGNVFADYVDAGGGVVVAVFANSTTTAGRNIGGRWQNGYEVILDQSGNASGAGGTLGTVQVPGHPSMIGVTSFLGGSVGSRPNGTALEVGAFVVAEWNNGKILVAQGANPNRIDLGFYPIRSACSGSGYVSGGDQIMVNSMLAAAKGATFGPYGTGCAGSLGVPAWQAVTGSRPVLGQTLTTQVANAPLGLAVIGLGVSNTSSGLLTLPFDLGLIGMPGCSLLADPAVTEVAVGTPSGVPWSFTIPNVPIFLGFVIYGQAFPFDPTVNPFGFTATNGARIKVGL
ncbi:MAG: hypothetical protein FJ306_03505 [Planctomycetes bacterium]|nr:hypothetical protein [Planctomycetota bacterium]